MKKLIVALFFSISSLVSFSQEATFAKAYNLFLGFKSDNNSPITWSSQATDVDILIITKPERVTIYSSEIQEFRIISLATEIETASKWFAVDQNGKQCFYYIGYDEASVFHMIEYSDYAFLYRVIPDK